MERNMEKLFQDSTKGSLILVGGTVTATIISAIVSILVGRFLGPENYGLYSLSLVLPQIFFLVTDFGIREGIIKFAIENRAKDQIGLSLKIIKYGLILRTFAGLVSFIALFLTADYVAEIILNRPNIGFLIRMSSVSILFQAIFSTSTSAFIGLDKPVQSSLITQIQSICKALISILLIALGFGITGAVLGYVFGFVFAGIIGVLMLLLSFKKFDAKPVDFKKMAPNVKKLLVYGAPLYFSVIMIGIMPQFIDILLSFLSSNTDIGNFKATANFMVLLALIAQQLTMSFLPVFTKLNGISFNQTKSFFNFLHKYTTLIIIPLTVLLIIFSNEIVQFAYGATYSDAGLYLSIYSFLYFLTGVGYLTLPSLFNGIGKTRETLKLNAITFIIVLIISPIATLFFGIIGLIITILVAYTIGTFYGMFRAKRVFGIIFDLSGLSKIYLASFLSIIPSTIIVISLVGIQKMLLGAGLYVFIYLTLISVFKIISGNEIILLNKFIQKNKVFYPFKWVVSYINKILELI